MPGSWWRLALVALVGLALAAGGGSGLLFVPPQGPLPTPDVPWPESGVVTMILCGPEPAMEICAGKAITDAEKQEVERALRALPELTALRFDTQATAWEEFRRTADEELVANTRQSDLSELFHAELSTVTGVEERLKGLPGVASLRVSRSDFWTGRAHLSIEFCAPEINACDEPATEQEKSAVYDRLRALSGVRFVYFETGRHGLENLERGAVGKTVKHPGFFHVRVAAIADEERVRKEIVGMKGVADVQHHARPL